MYCSSAYALKILSLLPLRIFKLKKKTRLNLTLRYKGKLSSLELYYFKPLSNCCNFKINIYRFIIDQHRNKNVSKYMQILFYIRAYLKSPQMNSTFWFLLLFFCFNEIPAAPLILLSHKVTTAPTNCRDFTRKLAVRVGARRKGATQNGCLLLSRV